MTVYEQELRKLFEHSDLVDRPQFSGRVCVGDLGKDLRVRAEFLSTHISSQYDAIRLTVLNRTEGVVDRTLLRFQDVWGKKQVPNNPNFRSGVIPHLWDDYGKVEWYAYAAMSAVKERLWEESLPFPLLTLGRNAPHIIEQFRHTPGAVLLATGAAWEGFDFPGDCVSLLIIPRLPFAYPDARKERELEKYSSLHAFIREVAVPEMQIKLRQGFGRAIRTESDTCVIAILDERACRGRRYAQAVSEALPEMRRTGSLREVNRFLREKKPESYFEVGR